MNKAKIKDIYYGLKNISIVKKEDFVEFVWFLVDSNEISQNEYLKMNINSQALNLFQNIEFTLSGAFEMGIFQFWIYEHIIFTKNNIVQRIYDTFKKTNQTRFYKQRKWIQCLIWTFALIQNKE